MEVLKNFPSESIDMVMFSPPYWGLRDYGTVTEKVWEEGWKGQLGAEPHPRKYVDHMLEVCGVLRKVLKKTGSMYIVLGDTYSSGRFEPYARKWSGQSKEEVKVIRKPVEDLPPKCLIGMPWRVAFALIEDGWILRNDIIWHKPNAMPSSVKDRFTSSYEHVFFFVKSKRYYFDMEAVRERWRDTRLHDIRRAGKKIRYRGKHKTKEYRYSQGLTDCPVGDPSKGRHPRDVWSIPTQPLRVNGKFVKHFATYPEKLCETPIKASCPPNGIVLDPMVGSGTTCVVAKRLGRRWIGIDLNPDYVEIAKKRLKLDLTESKVHSLLCSVLGRRLRLNG